MSNKAIPRVFAPNDGIEAYDDSGRCTRTFASEAGMMSDIVVNMYKSEMVYTWRVSFDENAHRSCAIRIMTRSTRKIKGVRAEAEE